MNDPSQMINRSYGMWLPPLPPPADDQLRFPNPNRPQQPPFAAAAADGTAMPGRMNWKGKKAADKRNKSAAAAVCGGAAGPVGAGVVAHGGGRPGIGGGSSGSGYKPPGLHELQFQNRVKARRFYPKKKFSRFAPFAPRNTSSFIIRAKKSGGIASMVSPCPVTPAILPTPKFSPTREGLVDMAKEEWGVDGYGSMKGLIRLRSPNGYEMRSGGGEDEEEEGDGSSESDVEEHLEVERRLDHDLSRFEMVYPADDVAPGPNTYSLENRVDDQDSHIAQLEEENLTLKERFFLMEQEMADLRRRLQLLETLHCKREDNNDNIGENENDNDNCVDGVEEAASENDGGGDVSSEKSVGDCEESTGTPMHEH